MTSNPNIIVSGNNSVTLRLVKIEDAKFILDLRSDKKLGAHISKLVNGIKGQEDFLNDYKKREKEGREYYFIIESGGDRVGCVRIYNINKEKKTFTWGSWIVMHGNPGYVALSSAYLSYHFAFNHLLLDEALFDVRNKNISVKNLYKTYANVLYEDELNCYFSLKKNDLHRFERIFKGKIPEDACILAD